MILKRLSIIILAVFLFTGALFSATPPVYINVSSKTLRIGDVLKVKISTNRRVKKTSIGFTDRHFKFFKTHKTKEHFVSYIAAARKVKAKTYPLKVYVTFENGEKFEKSFPIKVIRPKFKEGKVTLNKKKNDLSKSTKKLVNEGQIIGKAYRRNTYLRYFKGLFVQPANGRISSEFGKVRVYNDSYRRSHAGVDIANVEGTPIVASNAGKIVYSDFLPVHGHTVIIDHGRGIISIYNHLSKRRVKLKQFVEKGQRIGDIGQTGVATGPHVHWGMSVQNVRVDPLYLTRVAI
jgi:murein DD-endopeptidase MepM/ murein hydrolase activator NlpD